MDQMKDVCHVPVNRNALQLYNRVPKLLLLIVKDVSAMKVT